MRVRAIQRGFYGGVLREPGQKYGIFTLEDPKHFSEKWMERVDEDTPGEDVPAKVVIPDETQTFNQAMQPKKEKETKKEKPAGKKERPTGDQEVI